jgi:hypothetical protein
MGAMTKNLAIFGLAILFSFSLLSPSVRQWFVSPSFQADRFVLATLEFPIEGDLFKIVKIKSQGNILVEIYQQKQTQSILYTSFDLKEKTDVFYDFKSSVTNLFIADVDEDQMKEILVPVMGKNLDSQLSVIKYTPETKKFAIF